MDLRRVHLSSSYPRCENAHHSVKVGEGSQSAGKENNPSPGFQHITWPEPNNQVQESLQVTHSQDMALLETWITPGWMIHWPTL